MKKETKNVINKEMIAKELRDKDKKGDLVLSISAIAYVIMVSCVALAVYFFGLKNIEVGVIGYVIFFVCVFICFWPLLFFIFLMIFGPKGQKTEDFVVITDEVLYKEEMTINTRDSLLTKKVIHFCKCGDIEVNSTWYQLTSNGDTYYMVVRDKESKYAFKCYPTKLYEYVE